MAYHRHHERRRADRAHLQHLRAAGCGPTTGGPCRTSSRRRCEGKPITIFGDGSQTRGLHATSTTRCAASSPCSTATSTRAGQHRQPDTEYTIARAGRSWPSRSPGRRARSSTSRCRSTTRRSASRTSRWPAPASAGSPPSTSTEGLGRTADYFRELARAPSSTRVERRERRRRRSRRPRRPRGRACGAPASARELADGVDEPRRRRRGGGCAPHVVALGWPRRRCSPPGPTYSTGRPAARLAWSLRRAHHAERPVVEGDEGEVGAGHHRRRVRPWARSRAARRWCRPRRATSRLEVGPARAAADEQEERLVGRAARRRRARCRSGGRRRCCRGRARPSGRRRRSVGVARPTAGRRRVGGEQRERAPSSGCTANRGLVGRRGVLRREQLDHGAVEADDHVDAAEQPSG